MGSIEVSEQNGDTKIKIDGIVTIEHAEKISTSIKDSLESAKSILLDLKGVQKVDVSFLQLLVSLDIECSRQNIMLAVESEGIPERIISTVEQLGFSHCSEVRRLFHLT